MKVLILGGGGFVGSHLAEAELLSNEVTCYDMASPDKVKHLMDVDGFTYLQYDATNPSLLTHEIEKCDMVYHLAAIADPKIYCENPLKVLKIDLEVTQNVIKDCCRYNKKLIFASTSEIYGKNSNVPWKENEDRVLGSTDKARWSYSTSKAAGEHYCYAYGMEGLKFVVLRFFNFYGPRLDFIGTGRVMTCFLEKFLKEKPVEVVKPGIQTRCFTYISDGIRGLMKAAHTPSAEGKVFNLGADTETSIIDLAHMMKKVGGFKSDIKMISAEKKYGKGYDDILRRVPDCSKAKKILDWNPHISLTEGLYKTIKYYVSEKGGIK